jgi:hypothetical protein
MNTNTEWEIGEVNLPKNSSNDLLQLLNGKITTYKTQAEEYYEEEFEENELKLKIVESIFKGVVITK